jgi:hypothetical protein
MLSESFRLDMHLAVKIVYAHLMSQTKFVDRSVIFIKFRNGLESGELHFAILSHLPTFDRMSLLRRQRDERFMVLRLAKSYDGRDVPMGENIPCTRC